MRIIPLAVMALLVYLDCHGQIEENEIEGNAIVYIFRANLANGITGRKDLFIDDDYVGEIRDFKYLELSLPPGEHRLWVRNSNPAYLFMRLEANKTYLVHAVSVTHKFKPHYRLIDFADYRDFPECDDCYTHGLKRLKKQIAKGKALHYSVKDREKKEKKYKRCLLYTSPSPRD